MGVPTVPARVLLAQQRATEVGFEFSSDPEVGFLLAALAASVPFHGRILELGTGVGHGLAWIAEGLGGRQDVEVVTVDADEEVQAIARRGNWPDYITFVVADGAEAVAEAETFDLIFPDAPGGKLTNLAGTINALRPGGMLLVDDMHLDRHTEPLVLHDGTSVDLRDELVRVRSRLLDAPALVCAELPFGSGVILASKRRS